MDNKGVKVIRGDGKEVIFEDSGIRIVHDGNVTFETMEAIQETYSLNPKMFTHVQDAPIVPEEIKKEYVEAIGAELAEKPNYDYMLKTASFLNKEGLE